jgi:hypothetical protein
MEKIPRQSGKEGAANGPSWARGKPPGVGEMPEEFGKRLMDERYGRGNWENDPERKAERRKIGKSWKGYRIPKKEIMVVPDTDLEA